MTYLVNIDGLTFTLQGKDYILAKGSIVDLPKHEYVDILAGRGYLTAQSAATPVAAPIAAADNQDKNSPSK